MGHGHTETVTDSAPLILAGIFLTETLTLKDAELLSYYPRGWGLKSFTGDYFLLILSLLVVTCITLILRDEAGRGNTIADTMALCSSRVGCICGTIHLQQLCAIQSPRFTAWLHAGMGPNQASLPKGPLFSGTGG